MRFATTFLVLLALVSAVSAQDPARAMIQRAIVAHGGLDKLSAARADRIQFKGTLHVGTATVPFTDEVVIQPPGQFKSTVRISENGRTRTIVHLLDGDKASILVDGQPQPVSSSNLAQMRQTLQLAQAMKLVPLLTDPAFSVALVGEYQHNGRPVVCIRVAGHSQRDLRLYFDKETALLIKSEHLLDGVGGKDVKQEALYSDYREVGGYLRPGRVSAFRDGNKVMETELIDARRFDRIDAREFNQP